MNEYLKNLEKIEFVITNACTGRCKHCSQGEHNGAGESIDPITAAELVKRVTEKYDIKTVMTFGGEPLLYPDAVYAVMASAFHMKVQKRQVITNGYFSKDIQTVKNVAKGLLECGVNDLLVSVDAFHQEYIPFDGVRFFAEYAKKIGIPLRAQPAWLCGRADNNIYNQKTERLLFELRKTGIEENEGNDIFPEGNAIKYFGKYFKGKVFCNPYTEDSSNIKCISIGSDGSVLGGNIYTDDILRILDEYTPF